MKDLKPISVARESCHFDFWWSMFFLHHFFRVFKSRLLVPQIQLIFEMLHFWNWLILISTIPHQLAFASENLESALGIIPFLSSSLARLSPSWSSQSWFHSGPNFVSASGFSQSGSPFDWYQFGIVLSTINSMIITFGFPRLI